MTKEELVESIEERRRSNKIYQKEIKEKEELISKNAEKLNVVKTLFHTIEELSLKKRHIYKEKIEAVITEVLRTLYGTQYSFLINYGEKNNRSCLEIEVKKTYGDYEVKRDISGHGGGISDSICIPLRALILKGSQDIGDILFLDEAYKHVDSEIAENVGMFLRGLCEKMEMQIIMLSHNESILQQAERGFFLENRNGKVYLK
ncbi:MAG: hypothetical protein M0P12_01125 [Paludibacteraceae bacterium]|nr:hypothetical protein [Paludibacteraceae bacterium]MCK9615941.1 hypothetical protein [Candidatus Omnitrophota bacterium]